MPYLDAAGWVQRGESGQNIVALGVITCVSGIVPLDAVKTAVAHRVPPHTVDANMQALMVGYEAAKE